MIKPEKTMQLCRCETMPQCLICSPHPLILKQKKPSSNFKIFSQTASGDEHHPSMTEYLASWVKNPDTGSKFAENLGWLKLIPANSLLKVKLFLGYDALFYIERGKIVGHIFFRWHINKIKIFSVFVSKELRKGAALLKMFSNLFSYLNTLSEFPDIKVGAGGYVKEKKLLAAVNRLKRLNRSFEIKYLGNYYFRVRKKCFCKEPARVANLSC